MLLARASRALVIMPKAGRVVAFNFLTKSAFTCNSGIVDLLSLLAEWTGEDRLAAAYPGVRPQSVSRELRKLADLHAVVVRGEAYAELEESYLTGWEWGPLSGLFHFALRDTPCIGGAEAVRRQIARATEDPSPALYLTHPPGTGALALAPPRLAGDGLLAQMARRRTHRDAAARRIGLAQLADCLFAGLGITGEAVTETGLLPLAMTPSGGARNPFEAYVLARAVEGLESGVYHYSAAQHSLARIAAGDVAPNSAFLGDQSWTDAMPCAIFLVAHFERTMWKYSDNNGYRVVLIEAGHIGQNIMLAATAHGLSACPTAALYHSRIAATLGLTGLATAPVYALTLSVPAEGRATAQSTSDRVLDHPPRPRPA